FLVCQRIALVESHAAPVGKQESAGLPAAPRDSLRPSPRQDSPGRQARSSRLGAHPVLCHPFAHPCQHTVIDRPVTTAVASISFDDLQAQFDVHRWWTIVAAEQIALLEQCGECHGTRIRSSVVLSGEHCEVSKSRLAPLSQYRTTVLGDLALSVDRAELSQQF